MIALLAAYVWGDYARTRTCGVEVKDAPRTRPSTDQATQDGDGAARRVPAKQRASLRRTGGRTPSGCC